MNDFPEVRLFEDTQGSWFYWALICHRADFGHTVVIENACTLPSFLKAFSSGRILPRVLRLQRLSYG